MNKNMKGKEDFLKQYQETSVKYGILHCHTENSVDDSTQSTDALAKTAKELGAPAVALSDHGTMMGVDDFFESCKENDIKPIYGIEAYYLDDVTDMKSHLILYAMDMEGWHQICYAMARGVIINDGRTCLTDETLEYLKGGHVIATSACIQGVLGSIFLYNERKGKAIEKVKIEYEEFSSQKEQFEEAKKKLDDVDKELANVKNQLKELRALANTKFGQRQKRIETMKQKLAVVNEVFDTYVLNANDVTAKKVRTALSQLEVTVTESSEFETGKEEAARKVSQAEAQLALDMKKASEAENECEKLESKIGSLQTSRKFAKSKCDTFARDAAKADARLEKIEELEAEKLSVDRIKELLDIRCNKMLEIFGENFFMEVQNHGIDSESKIYPYLAKYAKKKGIKLVAANDCHVAKNDEKLFKARQIRRSCRFKTWEDEMVGDKELYLKNDYELASALIEILPEAQVKEAMANVGLIVSKCNVEFKKESHAPKAKVADATAEITKICRENIKKKFKNGTWTQVYEDRLTYELDVISSMGYSDYFYITSDILNVGRKIGGLSYEGLQYMKENGKDMDLDRFMKILDKKGNHKNLSIGLGRGSGAGSLVCFCLGITNVDPIKYDLLFERKLECVH